MNRALSLLSARALSVSELRTKLKLRAASAADIDGVIVKLTDAGYLNDQRMAESFAAARIENQSQGRMRVLRDLRARRVSPEVAEGAVTEAFREVDETALIETFLARKFRGKDLGALLKDERQLASAFRKLRTAGFGTSNSIKVLKRFASQAELLEEEPEDDSDPQ
ncbi:MAG: RecX family transcriptional regulator [Bryobacteraceae bacterium]